MSRYTFLFRGVELGDFGAGFRGTYDGKMIITRVQARPAPWSQYECHCENFGD